MSLIYNGVLNLILSGQIDLTKNIKMMLLNEFYLPDINHTWNDIIRKGVQVRGNGYTRGGEVVTGLNINNGVLSANNVTWRNISLERVRWALIYQETEDENKPNTAIAIYDLGFTKSFKNREVFSVIWGVGGRRFGPMIKFKQRTERTFIPTC